MTSLKKSTSKGALKAPLFILDLRISAMQPLSTDQICFAAFSIQAFDFYESGKRHPSLRVTQRSARPQSPSFRRLNNLSSIRISQAPATRLPPTQSFTPGVPRNATDLFRRLNRSTMSRRHQAAAEWPSSAHQHHPPSANVRRLPRLLQMHNPQPTPPRRLNKLTPAQPFHPTMSESSPPNILQTGMFRRLNESSTTWTPPVINQALPQQARAYLALFDSLRRLSTPISRWVPHVNAKRWLPSTTSYPRAFRRLNQSPIDLSPQADGESLCHSNCYRPDSFRRLNRDTVSPGEVDRHV